MKISYDKLKTLFGNDEPISAIIVKLAIYGITITTSDLCEILSTVAACYHSYNDYSSDPKQFTISHKNGAIGHSNIIFRNIFLLLFTTEFFKDIDRDILLKYVNSKLSKVVQQAQETRYKDKYYLDLIEIFAELKDRLEGKIK